MQYITTTELRTKSSQLINSLSKGEAISLIYRSRVIGEIKPKNEVRPLMAVDIKQLKKLAKKLNLPKNSYKQREKIYREHLMKKYGKGLS